MEVWLIEYMVQEIGVKYFFQSTVLRVKESNVWLEQQVSHGRDELIHIPYTEDPRDFEDDGYMVTYIDDL